MENQQLIESLDRVLIKMQEAAVPKSFIKKTSQLGKIYAKKGFKATKKAIGSAANTVKNKAGAAGSWVKKNPGKTALGAGAVAYGYNKAKK